MLKTGFGKKVHIRGFVNKPRLCSSLHILLKDSKCLCRTSENCKSLVLQDKCNIEIFLSPGVPLLIALVLTISHKNLTSKASKNLASP